VLIRSKPAESTELDWVPGSPNPVTTLPEPSMPKMGIFVAGLGTVVGRIFGALSAFAVATPPDANPAGNLRVSTRGMQTWKHTDTVKNMRELPADWNGYGSEAPNQLAREIAQDILLVATNIVMPSRVAASAQGGVGICFYNGNKYADIECLNTGEVLAAISDRSGRPEVWQIGPTEYKGALEKIGRFVNS
jgi:hypothetical protein